MTATTLQIDTCLGLEEDFDEDHAPFLLAMVQGSEGVSMPFSYDLTMYRSKDLDEADVRKLINTRVAIGIRHGDDWIRRRGMIASMSKAGASNTQFELKTDFYVYTAKIVPAFKMLDNEVRFRTFENKKFSEIFKEVIQDFPGISSGSYVSFSQLSEEEDQTIDYCVQFGESSFNFLSRLMAQLGIWYVFEHRQTRELSNNETMVLGKSLAMLQQCDQDKMTVELYEPKPEAIAQFARSYTPGHHHVWVADFNESNPTEKPKEPGKPEAGGDRDIMPQFDLQPGEPKAVSRFSLEQFPNNSSAATLIHSEEYGVFIATGQSENRTFQAGRTFRIIKDNANKAHGDLYMIAAISFSVHYDLRGQKWELLNLLGDFTWKPVAKPFAGGWKPVLSVAGSLSTQMLANYLQNEGPYRVGSLAHLHKDDGSAGGANKPYFGVFTAGGLIAAGAGVLQSLFDGISKVEDRHEVDSKYANSFVASPYVDGAGWRMPLPAARSPTVNGVHLAVVVGPQGVDPSGRGQIFTNDKGQVRIRFGWQRTVSPELPDPLATDARAAWVRVSESWAGRQTGSQFLPRVGDEVVVSFIDGDPARPIITGRVYNDYATQPFDPQHTTQSGFRTRSTPLAEGGTEKFHMLRFDDKPGSEQLLLRSQGRLDVTALGTKYETIGGDLNQTIGWIDTANEVAGGDHVVQMSGDYNLHVGNAAGPFNGGNRIETVEKHYSLHVKQETEYALDGDWSVQVGGKASISADTIVLNAVKSITLVVGNSVVVLQPDGIYNEAAIHYEQCGAEGQSASDVAVLEPRAPTRADNGSAKTSGARH